MMSRNPSLKVSGVTGVRDTELLNYHVSAKVCRNVFPNVLKKRNLTAIPLFPIPEYGQSNAT